jgi:hypothetical protein
LIGADNARSVGANRARNIDGSAALVNGLLGVSVVETNLTAV